MYSCFCQQGPLMRACAFGLRSWLNRIWLQIQAPKTSESLFSFIRSPECIMPPVIHAASNWADSHFHYEQTQDKCGTKKIHTHLQMQHSKFLLPRVQNNEPAYRAGLIQSQVPALKIPRLNADNNTYQHNCKHADWIYFNFLLWIYWKFFMMISVNCSG